MLDVAVESGDGSIEVSGVGEGVVEGMEAGVEVGVLLGVADGPVEVGLLGVHDGAAEGELVGVGEALSWECRRHVANMSVSVTCVGQSWLTRPI